MPKLTHKYNLKVLYPKVARECHPEKNGGWTARDFTPGSHNKIWWLFPKQHDYEAVIKERTGKDSTGCPYCSGNKVSEDNNLLFMFPDIAAEWHPTKNDDNKPEDFTLGSKKKVWWLCKNLHEWEAIVKVRVGSKSKKGTGCPHCRKKKSKTGSNKKKD